MAEIISNKLTKNRSAISNFKTAAGNFDDSKNHDELNILEIDSFQDLEYYYLNSLIQRFCTAISDELSDSEIVLNCDDKIYNFISKDVVNYFLKQSLESLTLENIYGGCLIVSDRTEPKEKSSEYFIVDASRAIPLDVVGYDRYSINNCLDFNLIVNSDNFYKLHGRYLPQRLRESNQGWGRSLIEIIIQSIISYESSNESCKTLLRKLNVLIYGMKEFGNILATENISGNIINNLNEVFEILELHNVLMIDSEIVNAAYANRSLSGVEHLIKTSKEQLEMIAMSTISMPSILLWGKAGTSGLADKGSAELDIWYKSCNNVLQNKVIPLLKWMILNYIPFENRKEFKDIQVTSTQLQEYQQTEKAKKEEIEEKALTLKQTRLIQLMEKGIITDKQLKKFLEIEDDVSVKDVNDESSNKIKSNNKLELIDDNTVYDFEGLEEDDLQKALEWDL